MGITYFLEKLLNLKRGELKVALISFMMFALIFCSYSVLRPIRETMGIVGGVKNLQWLFTATFVFSFLVQIPFAKAVSHYSRHLILPIVFCFCSSNLIIFAILMANNIQAEWTGRVFFVWISVYNLLVISLGWSVLNDVLKAQESKRIFAIAAAGSSFGSVVGPSLTAVLSSSLGLWPLLCISAILLLLSSICSQILFDWRKTHQDDSAKQSFDGEKSIKGSVLTGFIASYKSTYLRAISIFILLSSCVNTFMYFELMNYVAITYPSTKEQTVVFSLIDLIVNVVTISLQLLITGRIATKFGLKPLLLSVPLFAAIGFLILLFFPMFIVIAITMMSRRICEYALVRPGREMLFSYVSKEDKYKSKNFIDTVVYRFGDLISAYISRGLGILGGGSASASAFGGALFAIIWAMNAYYLTKLYKIKQDEDKELTNLQEKI